MGIFFSKGFRPTSTACIELLNLSHLEDLTVPPPKKNMVQPPTSSAMFGVKAGLGSMRSAALFRFFFDSVCPPGLWKRTSETIGFGFDSINTSKNPDPSLE